MTYLVVCALAVGLLLVVVAAVVAYQLLGKRQTGNPGPAPIPAPPPQQAVESPAPLPQPPAETLPAKPIETPAPAPVPAPTPPPAGDAVAISPEAEAILANIRKRLLAVEDNPAYRFKNTRRADAAEYRSQRRRFAGYSEAEIAVAEQRLGVQFPVFFRAFLRTMGKENAALFEGLDAKLEDFEAYRKSANELMQENGAGPLPDNAVVFVFGQGVSFSYFIPDGSFDPPVYGYSDGDAKAAKTAGGFAQVLNSMAEMTEQINRMSHEQGGTNITITEHGVTEEHPAAEPRPRPMDQKDEYSD